MLDLITQCETVKKISDEDVGEKQAMGNTNQRHIHPNSKNSKFHRKKKTQSKRTETPLSFTLFKNNEEFIKRITANEPVIPMQKTKIVDSLFSV